MHACKTCSVSLNSEESSSQLLTRRQQQHLRCAALPWACVRARLPRAACRGRALRHVRGGDLRRGPEAERVRRPLAGRQEALHPVGAPALRAGLAPQPARGDAALHRNHAVRRHHRLDRSGLATGRAAPPAPAPASGLLRTQGDRRAVRLRVWLRRAAARHLQGGVLHRRRGE